ncbi:MAG: DUF2252 domain-containing protein [Rhodospirillaceae bacterium]|nr:MAG: DUF2252 domain-containing protein [Rhodospirillaceae bacterium]
MAASPFALMRSTFYRWVPLWHEICAGLGSAPRVLAVGDLHVENFGTWRDGEGRLVWGVNDVDEAASMPYTLDLTRLAASALLARREAHLSMAPSDICRIILRGYRHQLEHGGRAFVLEEDHGGLRAAALSADRDPVRFWEKMASLPTVSAPVGVRRLLAAHLPEPGLRFRIAHRIAGLGSLGRPRYVALAQWEGGLVAREAKAMLPSAYGWALGKVARRVEGATLLARAVRCADPTFAFAMAGDASWLLRRLAPHCSRIELAMLPKRREEATLLEAMGRETANLHLGTRGAATVVRADLKSRKGDWLLAAAKAMADATIADWKDWKATKSP